MMRGIGIAAGCVALLSGPVAAQETIRIGEPNWFSGTVVASVLEHIIETEFGVQAERIPATNPEIYESMLANDGAFHMHADAWLPGHNDWVDAGLSDGTLRMSDTEYAGKIGLCAPRYTVEALNLRAVGDMDNPNVISTLDSDGDGRIPIWVGGDGWQMTAVGTVKLRDYGLSQFYDAVVMDEPVYQEELYAAFARREHVVFGCYEPMTWFAMEYIEYIEEPAYDANRHNLVLPSQSDTWLQESTVLTGESPSSVKVVYSTEIERNHPEIGAFLSRFGLTNDDITEFMFLTELKGIEMEFVVADWVAANAGRVETWING